MTDLKLGLRNLARNRWRSGLTLAAVAVAVALMVWSLALYEGWIRAMIRGATDVETGHVQVHAVSYVERPRAYRSFPMDSTLLDRIRAVPAVTEVTPRVELHGLVGNEQRSQVARILGVDPRLESSTTPVAGAVVRGRWLAAEAEPYPAPREAVLGAGVARQLQAGPGEELVAFLEAADGSLGNELLRVVGVVETRNTGIDGRTVYLRLEDAQYLAALEGEVHELAVATDDPTDARRSAERVAGAIGARADELVVRSWQAVLPGLDQMIVVFRRSYWILYLFVYLLAAAGVLNTQRMSALERRRELAVMMAVGMRPRRTVRTLLVETGVLGTLGAVLGAALGVAVSRYHEVHGLDMGLFTDQAAFSYMGVSFSERLYFSLETAHVIQPVAIMLLVALASGLWPALRSARIDPAPAIAGRTE